ncbi:protein eva-1 homolog C [Coregonus clupeaformis]|uniref:protein eva-1 homolog C n=1 Tax=Coregonus clupeaformis TaxID=59861 RepID=UPI001BDF88B0|nr:protein eva-1 homolog C [Coregonus clupeaformis]
MRGAMSWSGSHRGLSCSGSGINLLYLSLLLWSSCSGMDGLADFSNYLSRIITSHSVHACDGQQLRLYCPRHSTISIQSAFYGRADARLCTNENVTAAGVSAGNHSCSAFTTLQKLLSDCQSYRDCQLPVNHLVFSVEVTVRATETKLLSECQSYRDCQLPVNHLVFGPDPCPGTIKYLHVIYKCKPTEHKISVVCEGEKLTLRCKPPRVLIIYTAAYGRGLGHTCPSQHRGIPPFECLNHNAVHTLSQSCYSKQRCVVAVDNQTFRDPCYPGTRKYLTVLYSCVPQTLLQEADPGVLLRPTSHSKAPPGPPPAPPGHPPGPPPGPPPAPSSPPPGPPPGPPPAHPGPADVAVYPKGSRTPGNTGVMMSNSVMTYSYIKEHPETAALLFTSSVCVGLLLTLLAVSVRLTCRGLRHTHTHRSQEEEEEEEDDEEEKTDCSLLSDSDRQLDYCWEEVSYRTADAERVERMERRDMVIQEIWMNSYLYGVSCDLD